MTAAGPDPGPARQALPDTGRVDFYVLAAADAAARLHFACRLTEKAYHLKHRVHLHTELQADAAKLDDLLWTFRQGSFVPHEILAAGHEAGSPVTIGFGALPTPGPDLLVNLASEIPAGAGNCARVAEIIDGSEASRSRGRKRFREYQQLGCELTTHNIGNAQ